MAEEQRLKFMKERDGVEGAVAFARQTLKAYRMSLRRSRKRGFDPIHHATLPEFRRGFVESCLAFRAYLRGKL